LSSAWKLIVAVAAVFVVLQCVRPGIPRKPAAAEIEAPPEIHGILEKDCYSCHSDQPRLAWFDEIQPGYWLVRKDILTAREHLDFSSLGSKPAAAQKATLFEAVNMIQLGAMPLPRFTALHPDAKVSAEELAALKEYLAPWGPLPAPAATPGAAPELAAAAPPVSLAAVGPEWTGVAFDPTFEGWKALSFSDRGDNNTFRFILGNDVAIQAAETGHISPWPDGSRFAKVTWQQELGSDGMVHAGKFVQVELMMKGAKQYASTEGWGWGRWRGLDLKPYGSDAHFVNECTGCHLPVKGDDYVYTPPITSARSDLAEDVNNRAAALPASLLYQPLHWTPITMFVDRQAHTMSTLYGNDAAARSLDARSAVPATPLYGQGAVLALVTWAQRDDPHWFGARIPDRPATVEFVTLDAQNASSYRRFEGPGFEETHPPADSIAQRTAFVVGLKPAPLP
jgi:Haem-binding domain/Cytochrome P460